MKTIYAGARYYKVQPGIVDDPGFPYIELGPPTTPTFTGTMIVQFNPGNDFDGSFVVTARPIGTAADAANVPFVPIAYRVLSLNDVPQFNAVGGPPWTDAQITGVATIAIPASGLTIALLTAWNAGSCDITPFGVQGSPAM